MEEKINVPFTYETELSGIKDENVHYAVWYNRKINVSKENIIRQNVLLHFEGSDYLTEVWINGKYIGINEGGYCYTQLTDVQQEINGLVDENRNE